MVQINLTWSNFHNVPVKHKPKIHVLVVIVVPYFKVTAYNKLRHQSDTPATL